MTTPTSGYPILGFTNLIFSQCYVDANQTAQVRAFFARHYGVLVNNVATSNNRLLPLPTPWEVAARETFLTAASGLSIGNPNVCSRLGSPSVTLERKRSWLLTFTRVWGRYQSYMNFP